MIIIMIIIVIINFFFFFKRSLDSDGERFIFADYVLKHRLYVLYLLFKLFISKKNTEFNPCHCRLFP